MGDRATEKIILTEVFATKDGEERKKKLIEKVIKLIKKKEDRNSR
ncbi:hypothetical protein [Caloramator proteoclasticus]|uniref:Uncharacterized protein n=1 Tax=Caloramator proteoclasticus DSM 10124 TaxID=1121262 RepID=A0A1M4VAI3_9CLOT|nr:hypothetical protein [Caloramator proteoclasticus]SHE65959.1 hypothetical protein SAMN02746091_00845 [Caloramator proteoclasticus DSM 10124]